MALAGHLGIVYLFSCFVINQSYANVLFEEEPAFNVTLGGVEFENQEIGNIFSASFIAENLQIPALGRIILFQFKAGSSQLNSTVFLQVWRYVEGDTYQLTRNKRLTSVKAGLNEVVVNWLVPQGDILGLSCNGYCPVLRGPSDPNYKSKVSMTDYPIEYAKYSEKSFRDHDLTGKMSLLAVLEINGNREDFFTTMSFSSVATEQTTTSGNDPTTRGSTSGDVPSELPTVEAPQGQITEGVWWQWLLIAAGTVIVLLVIALLIVAAVSWRRERSSLRSQVNTLSRSNSRLTSAVENTLTRSHPEAHAVEEIGAYSERESGLQGAIVRTSSPAVETTRVEFDNGVTNIPIEERS